MGAECLLSPNGSNKWLCEQQMGEMYTMMKFFKALQRAGLAMLVALAMLLPGNPVMASTTNTSTAGFTMNGTTVTGYNGSGGSLAIPETATAIAANAFSGKTSITALTIPSSVTSIGDHAFSNCTGLTSMTIPGSVSSLGTGVFSGCSRLSSVSMQAAVNSIPNSMFSGCSALTSVAISSTINSIGSNAFENCKSLASMAVPAGVTTIGSGAFQGCTGLSGISIPASTSSIATNAFSGCLALSTINVASGNGTYASDGGCLYNASYTKLLICPPAKSSIALNSALKVIGSSAFNGCTRITSLTIPSGATSIESGAFNGSAITSITIPKSVTSIGDQSWSPDIIYGYSGSEAESYAAENGYVFYSLDGGDSGDSDEDTTEIQTGNANYEDEEDESEDLTIALGDDDSSDLNVSGGSSSGGTSSGSSSSGSSSSKSSSSSGSSSSGSSTSKKTGSSSGAYASTTSNVHEVDNTPKTGDGFNPKFMICIALAFAGLGFFFLAKRKTE